VKWQQLMQDFKTDFFRQIKAGLQFENLTQQIGARQSDTKIDKFSQNKA
jgi:hypothetical protein